MKVDATNDLALLQAQGRIAALPVAASRGVKLGGTVATEGFSQPRFARIRAQAGHGRDRVAGRANGGPDALGVLAGGN